MPSEHDRFPGLVTVPAVPSIAYLMPQPHAQADDKGATAPYGTPFHQDPEPPVASLTKPTPLTDDEGQESHGEQYPDEPDDKDAEQRWALTRAGLGRHLIRVTRLPNPCGYMVRAQVPQPHGMVVASHGEPPAVRGKSHRHH